MAKTPEQSGRSMIPTGEVPCVWMSAGVLSYRLCERGLDCSACPLDQALRNTPGHVGPVPVLPDVRTTRGGTLLPEDVFFHRGHCWVRARAGGEMEIGIDDLARKALGPVRSVTTPSDGEPIHADRAAIRIEGRFGRVMVNAPFTGYVNRRNPALDRAPDLVRSDPYGEGWILRGVASEPTRTFAGLRSGDRARSFLEAEEDRLLDLIAVAGPEELVETLADGGHLFDDLLVELENPRARRILDRLFRAPRAGREECHS